MYDKFSKCDFFKDRIQCLGHIVCKDGISVDPDKIKVITEWPVPTNVTDIRSFMGITGYYQNFIEVFSRISYPIISLQKKGIRGNLGSKMGLIRKRAKISFCELEFKNQ